MKIAICMNGMVIGKAGEPAYHQSREYMRDKIINFYNNSPSEDLHTEYSVDVFLHTWDHDNFDNDELINWYEPKKHIIEPQLEFQDEIAKMSVQLKSWTTMSWAHSKWESVKLKQAYEKENNFIYDVVLLCRYDHGFRYDWHVTAFEFNPWFDMNYVYGEYWNGFNEGPGDIYFYSNSKNIDAIGGMFKHMVCYLQEDSDYLKALEGGWPYSNADDDITNEIFKPEEKRATNLQQKGRQEAGTNHHLAKWHFMEIGLYDKIRPLGKSVHPGKVEY